MLNYNRYKSTCKITNIITQKIIVWSYTLFYHMSKFSIILKTNILTFPAGFLWFVNAFPFISFYFLWWLKLFFSNGFFQPLLSLFWLFLLNVLFKPRDFYSFRCVTLSKLCVLTKTPCKRDLHRRLTYPCP